MTERHKVKLQRQIGKGAFGVLYKGLYDGETVAIKTIGSAHGADSSSPEVQLFFKEADMLRQCHHGRIIAFKALVRLPPESGKQHGDCWALVMEYAKDGNLAQRVLNQMMAPTRKLYTTTQALSWALQVATALEYLHLRSPAVLHRDVKASNIMLTSEDGVLVAKLSDFGLHSTADSCKDRQLRCSFVTRDGGHGSSVHGGTAGAASCYLDYAGQQEQPAAVGPAGAAAPGAAGGQLVAVSDGSASERKPDDSSSGSSEGSASGVISGGSSSNTSRPLPDGSRVSPVLAAATVPAAAALQHHLLQQPGSAIDEDSAWMGGEGAAAAAAKGGEVHASDFDYSEVHDAAGGRSVYVRAPPAGREGSSHSAASDTLNAAPKRTSSFRRAAHHPTGDALPRVLDAAAASDANASLYAQLAAESAAGGGSAASSRPRGPASLGARSMVTDGTWVSDDSGDTGDTGDTVHDELETVFNMTGCTGSPLYMAPEVFQREAYNEKGDVFSFGVVLYELLARTLVMFSELPTSNSDPGVVDSYATKVAGGYRPAQPRSIPDDLWRLISACWHQDPLLRPHMSEVVAVLTDALAAASSSSGKAGGRKSFSIARSGTASAPPARTLSGEVGAGGTQPAAASAAAAADAAAPPSGCACVIC